MSKETLEELKAIYDDAPYENFGEEIFINTHGNYILFYEDDFYTRDNGKWVKCCGFLPCYGLRSLSDIKRIIEVSEQMQELQSAYTDVLIHTTDSRMSKPYLDASVVKSVIDEVAKEKSERLQEVLSEMAENANSNGYHDHAEAINEALERLDEEGFLL